MATKYSGVKESSDMLLVLDIMEHLYTLQHIGTYCIVSSDSDFTHIINRLKMNSKKVFGFGMSQANVTLKNSYHRYISLDLLLNDTLPNDTLSNDTLSNDSLSDDSLSDDSLSIDSLSNMKNCKNNKKN